MHPSASARHPRASPSPPRHACRVVVAAAGYGKTTALRGWYPSAGARWYRGLPAGAGGRAGEPAAVLAGVVVDEAASGAHQIVFDDLPPLPADTPRAVTGAIARLAGPGDPAADGPVDVVLASRWPLAVAVPAYLHGQRAGTGPAADVGPAELALSVDQVADLLASGYELTDWDPAAYDSNARDLPERIHEATAGWPALVHLAAETLRTHGVPHGPLLPAIAEPGGLIATYLAEEVLPALPEAALRLLRHVGDLAPLGAPLCRALGHPRPDDTVRLLARTGILTTAGSPPRVPGGPPAVARIVPVVAEAVQRGRRRSRSRPAPAALAAAWFDEHGPPAAAARAYQAAGRAADAARVLDRHGEAMLAAGDAETVVALVTALAGDLRTPRLGLLLGDALRAAGELDAAARAYETAARGGATGGAALAWRRGRIHYQRGDARAALAAFQQAGPGPHPPADAALLAAWTANAHLLAGDPEAALRHARRAVAIASGGEHPAGAHPRGAPRGSGDPDGDEPGSAHPGNGDPDGDSSRRGAGGDLAAALATAHVSVALCLGALGDDPGSEEHYRLALPVAERAGDVVLLTRVFTNRTYRLLRAARYEEALAAARTCARYAAAARQSSLRAIATCNEADALAMLGRFDEAVRQYERAVSAYQRLGSRRVAGALLGLGEVYRRRGWREQARAAYEDAVRVAGAAGNGHVLVPARAGLALVLLADEPAAAAEHAAAAADGAAEVAVPALLAQGWVALRRGDRGAAGELALRACGTARAQGDRAGLADALELRGASHPDASRAREALRESHAIWTETGAAVEAARLMVTISRLPGAGPDDRLRGLLAAERLAAVGAVVADPAAGAARDATAPDPAAAEVVVRALGRFEVRVAGEPVPASRWQSRKARDLLRILVARRGRPVPRDELCELLWPDDDPTRTGHRLSVLLSIVRGVLDPTRALAPDHYLVADQASIALDVTRLRVDVEDFLTYVAQARRLLTAGDPAQARELLVTVDRHHGADAFEDEPYAPWSGPLREETRAAYLSMLRMLARVSDPASGGGVDAAVGYLLRLLERDPYDEAAHRALVRGLVRAGRHGEARRAFDRYGEAMRSIGVRPPDRSLLAPRAAPAVLNGTSR